MQDIFEQIREIENGNTEWFDNLNDEGKNGVSFYMLLRWMSYTNDKKQVLHMNNLFNTKVFSIPSHKGLLYKLLCASANGRNQYKWLKRDSKKSSPLLSLISDIHNCGMSEAAEILPLYSKIELLDLCSTLDLEKAALDKLKKEINVL